MKRPPELTRAQNLQRSQMGMREDKGIGSDRDHRYSHGCTSRSLQYHPVRPPHDMTAKLPQLYRSEICEAMAAGHPKFSPTWNTVYGNNYTWADYFRTFPRRPDEQNSLSYEAWVKANPEAAALLDTEWAEFLKECK